jgi:hypothetical protein
MTIDLTAPVPHLVETCDCCAQVSYLYRLIGTTQALCHGCFAQRHG